jgi:hypothetical protein
MHEMEVPLWVAIVLTVLVQKSLNPMVVADNLLDGMDNNLLKVGNHKVDHNLLKVINLKVDNLMVDNLKVALNNHLKVASKNLLAVDDLITLHLRILKLASR